MKTTITFEPDEISDILRDHLIERGYLLPATAKARFKVTGGSSGNRFSMGSPAGLLSAEMDATVAKPKT